MTKINDSVLKRLLEKDNPALRYLTMKNLVPGKFSDSELEEAYGRINDYKPIKDLIEKRELYAGKGEKRKYSPYKKHEGLFWSLKFLADMHADGRDPRIGEILDYTLSVQCKNGSFAINEDDPEGPLCLTANVTRSLIDLGRREEPGVKKGIKYLIDYVTPTGGIPCDLDDSFYNDCFMAIPTVLKALNRARTIYDDPEKLEEARQILLKRLLERKVYYYINASAKVYYNSLKNHLKEIPDSEKYDEMIRFKREYKRNEDSENYLPKTAWLKFGFPRDYNPDLIEVMESLAESQVMEIKELEPALNEIKSAFSDDGYVYAKYSISNTLMDTEEEGMPSKWLTYKAYYILRKFGII